MDTNIESLPQKEVFYDYCIEHETPSSEFQLNYGEDLKLIKKEFAGMDKTIINKGGLVHASDKNDSYFAIVLFHTDKYHTMGGIERFLNHHFAQYSYSKIDFLTHTSKIIDRYQLNGFPEMIMKDFEFKKNVAIEWIKEKKLELQRQENRKDTPLQQKTSKIKWLGEPAEFGFIFYELFRNGYIEAPKNGDEYNASAYAEQLLQLFDVNGATASIIKTLSHKGTLAEENRQFIQIQDISKLKKKKKAIR